MRLAQGNVRNEIGKSGSANANEWKGMEEIGHLKGDGRRDNRKEDRCTKGWAKWGDSS